MNERTSDAELLDPLFTRRWSTRAFSSDPLSEAQIDAIFEAARWTPSWMNNQPWYYVYATDGADKQAILDVFMSNNRDWARHAPLVGLVIARTALDGVMARSRDFDTGAAMMALTVQATLLDLWVHCLGGIELDAAHQLIGLDRGEGSVICGFVVGRRGDPADLHEKLQAREMASQRKRSSEFAFRSSRLPAGIFADDSGG